MAAALKTWELENTIKLVDPSRDALYNYDAAQTKKIQDARPWKDDPNHFKAVRISAVALLKMVMHARSGGSIEIMGLMLGYVSGTTIVVTDAFRLPVEGTETRVNAQEEANEYMVDYFDKCRAAGQMENAVGWYHSHPGYGCWLSGIDVSTQHAQQTWADPFVAVVIDPDRTISAGKVEIGAFRTYPEGHTAPGGGGAGDGANDPDTDPEGFQTIPMDKMQDFGAYSDRYYPLDVSTFKSSLDARLLDSLWNKYWAGTLASSPLFTTHDYGTRQIADLAAKTRHFADHHASAFRSAGGQGPRGARFAATDPQLAKIVVAGKKIATEEEAGLMAAAIKERLFGGIGAQKRVVEVAMD